MTNPAKAPERPKPKAPPYLGDLRCVNCARCGTECVGQSDSQWAPHFGMLKSQLLTTTDGKRPYCPTCARSVKASVYDCAQCGACINWDSAWFAGRRAYCYGCVAPGTHGRSLAERDDAHQKSTYLPDPDATAPADQD